jgi:hypothetical protein
LLYIINFLLNQINTNEGYNRPNGRAIVFSLIAMASLLLAGCAAQRAPFPVDKYCSGSVSRTTPDGTVYTGPKNCGEFVFNVDAIDFLPEDSKFTGLAMLEVFENDIGASGEFSQIAVNGDLPPCVEEIIVRKEGYLNGAVAEFMNTTGMWEAFKTPDGHMSQGGKTLHDALAAAASVQELNEEQIACMQEYAPYVYTDEYIQMLKNYPSLQDLDHGDETTIADACSMVNIGFAAADLIGGLDIDKNETGFVNMLQFTDANGCIIDIEQGN